MLVMSEINFLSRDSLGIMYLHFHSCSKSRQNKLKLTFTTTLFEPSFEYNTLEFKRSDLTAVHY